MIARVLAALLVLAVTFGGIAGSKYEQGMEIAATERAAPATVSVAGVAA